MLQKRGHLSPGASWVEQLHITGLVELWQVPGALISRGRLFHQAGPRAEKALASAEANQTSLGPGRTRR